MKIYTTAIMLFSAHMAVAAPLPQEVVRNTSNEIDQYLANHLLGKELKANAVVDDSTFLRRSYVNISGRIPTAQEARDFLDNKSKSKRAELVEKMMKSDGYKSQMFNFWGDLLRIQTKKRRHGLGWHYWVKQAVDTNMPYDKFVNEMLSAEGDTTENPAVGYYLRDRNMLLDNVSNTVQVFLGNQIGCAQCHDHPFEDVTQKEYYELAAFSAGINYRSERADLLLSKIVSYELNPNSSRLPENKKDMEAFYSKLSGKKNKEVDKIKYDYRPLFQGSARNGLGSKPAKLEFPKDYQYNDAKPGAEVKPKTFFGPKISRVKPEDRKQAFADWVTSKENPYFTKVIVNRLWARVFGRGIVEPLDDWSETTKISHPELFDYLCKIMVAVEYDTAAFMSVLYNTRLFESAVANSEGKMVGSYDFQGPLLRRMRAEEFYDSLLTIEHGNLDEKASSNINDSWAEYLERRDSFFEADPSDLAALRGSVGAAQAKKEPIKKELAAYRKQANEAESAGDVAAEKKYRKLAKGAEKRLREITKGGVGQAMSTDRPADYSTDTITRASDIPTPYKPEGILRAFGASDRYSPDAGHSRPSIPQILTLLNGSKIAGVTGSGSDLSDIASESASNEEHLENIFLGIYSRRPSADELAKYAPLVGDSEQRKSLVRAMVSSKSFLFVQ